MISVLLSALAPVVIWSIRVCRPRHSADADTRALTLGCTGDMFVIHSEHLTNHGERRGHAEGSGRDEQQANALDVLDDLVHHSLSLRSGLPHVDFAVAVPIPLLAVPCPRNQLF